MHQILPVSAAQVQTLLLSRVTTVLERASTCSAHQRCGRVIYRKGSHVLRMARLRLTCTPTVEPQSSAGLRIVGNWAAAFNTAKENIYIKDQKNDVGAC